MNKPDSFKWPSFLEVGLLAAIALAVRLPHLASATPTYDEFYHLLAARGWLEDGTFHIGSGHYLRAVLFTRIVAQSLQIFGDTLAAGRVPAMVAGTLWALAVFAWTRRLAGGAAGWTAGLLFALDPGAVHLSQWVRFYTLQGLLVWIGAACGYELVTYRPSRRQGIAIAILGLVSWVLALHLQITSLLALGAVGLWGGATLGFGLSRPRHRALALAGGAALVGAGAWLATSGRAETIWNTFSGVPTWGEAERLGRSWYGWWLMTRYPTLATLFPVATLVALARFTRPALFALAIFVSAFIALSLGGAKAERYLYFALPYFFVIWGLAFAAVWPALRATADQALAALGGSRLSARARLVASGAAAALALSALLPANPALAMTWRMVFADDGRRPYRLSDWTKALPRLRPLADSADVVIASYILKPMYYLRRGDVALSYAELAELKWENGRPVEFSVDHRHGRPAISSPASLRRLMACFQSGLILVERFHLHRAILVPVPTSNFIEANAQEVPLPPASRLRAFRWRHSAPPDPSGCPPWQPSAAARPAS